MADSCDYYLTILKDEDRKAKKTHKCCECGRIIQVGETYNYQAGTGDGFSDFKTCQHCVISRDFINKKCRGFIYTEIKADLSEHIHVKEWGLRAARLYVGMNRKWKKFKDDGLMPIPKWA